MITMKRGHLATAKSYITHNALVNLCPLGSNHWHKKEKQEKQQ